MFEYDQHIVNSLLSENDDFKRLYEKYDVLKQRVNEVNSGTIPMDDFSLEKMKKEKLLLKDRMAHMIEDYRRAHVWPDFFNRTETPRNGYYAGFLFLWGGLVESPGIS